MVWLIVYVEFLLDFFNRAPVLLLGLFETYLHGVNTLRQCE